MLFMETPFTSGDPSSSPVPGSLRDRPKLESYQPRQTRRKKSRLADESSCANPLAAHVGGMIPGRNAYRQCRPNTPGVSPTLSVRAHGKKPGHDYPTHGRLTARNIHVRASWSLFGRALDPGFRRGDGAPSEISPCLWNATPAKHRDLHYLQRVSHLSRFSAAFMTELRRFLYKSDTW